MPLDTIRPNHNHTSEYQQSGVPWLKYYASAANQKVSFPYVTRWIIITSEEAAKPVTLAFSDSGIAAGNYITVPAATMSQRMEVKCKEIHITCAGKVSIMAGLTNVKAADFPDITNLPGIE